MNRVLRLLIVDDLENWRYSLRLQFEQRDDIEVSEASSPEDAINKIKAKDYDLILLDLKMPLDTDGLETLSQIKQLKPQAHVIMMSAYGDIPKAVEAMKRGALDFVPKEADFDNVIAYKTDEFIRTKHLIADRELLIRAKYKAAQKARNPQKKGKALEQLLAALLESIEGFIEIKRDIKTSTEEIDIVFRNGSRDPFWQKQGEIVLVECKNWKSQKVGKNEVVLFKEKIENRYGRCKLGFLVCTQDFAKTLRREMLRSSKTDLLVVPINGRDLHKLVLSVQRNQLLLEMVERALLS